VGSEKQQLSCVGLRYNGITAPFKLDGAMDGPHFLCRINFRSDLKKDDIIFIDNVSTHFVDGVETIETRGASVYYLPAYSPDFNHGPQNEAT